MAAYIIDLLSILLHFLFINIDVLLPVTSHLRYDDPFNIPRQFRCHNFIQVFSKG